MKNAFKVTTTLAALLLTSGLAVEMLSAVHTNRPLQVSTGKAYVSNAAPGTTTIVVTIIDDARDTDDTAATQTIPAAGLIVTNITTDPATNTLAIGASATEIAFGVWTAAVTINTAGTTSTNNGIFANGGDHIQITYTTVFFTLTNARAPFTDLPYVIVDAEGPTVENNTPPYSFSSTTQRQLLQAEVVDAVSGMGSSQSEVAGNAAVIVDGTPFVPAVADLGGGRWLASAEVILSAGSHSWTVAARDVLGNVTGGPMPTQGIAATLDKDYVGNAAPGTTTIVVTIDDGARDTDSTAGTDSIPAADLVVTNLTTESATNTLQIGTSATESAVGVWSAIITVNTTGTTPTNNGIFANGGDHIQVTYTDAAGVTIIIRTPNLSNPYVVVDAQGPTVENNSPPYSFTTTTQRQLPQAEVFDAASGMGSSRSEVAGNVAVIVDGTAFVPAVADLGSGRWLVAVEVVLSAGSHTWSVAARDVLGNVTGGPMPAQAIAATLDKDYVGNASPATTTLVVTIDDPSRAGAGTLPASALVVDNITTAITTDMIEIGTLATEIGSTGVFTAVVSVDPSTTNSAAPLIAAVHGDQVQALYTTVGAVTVAALTPSGDTAAVVDALGPIITNMLPVDGASTNDSSPTLQADISDTGAGVGTIKSEVQSNSIILVDAAGNLPLATDLGGGVWRISFTPALFAGFHTWQVRVSDALGNVTNSSVLNLAIDFNAPAFVSGITGDTLDALNNVVVAANDRRAIHVVFNEELDGTSVATDGSDFRVQLYLGGPVLAVAGAELGAVPLHQDVFITMVDELPVGAVPIVTIVGIVSDGVTSGLGVAVAGEAWDAASGTIVRNVRDSVHVTFGAALNATTLQGSDFQVDGIAPVGLVFPNLDVGAAGNNTGTDLRDNLFLTLGSDLTLVATPTVEIVGSIRDLAASELTLASVTASSGIDPAADLSVTKAASQASVTVGQDITYTVTIGNSGPETSTGVILTDPLSAGLTFVSATSTQGTCTESSGIVTCDLGTLGVGASATVTVVANVSSVVNTASVSSDVLDPNVTNNAATQTTPLTIPTGVLTASQWALMIMAVAFGVLLVWRRLLTSREEA